MSRFEIEESISNFWEKNRCFEKSVSQRPASRPFVFYDGPPFATGLPHYGHILGLTVKDVFPRYWTMKGFRVERRWGWDCHGLPVENIAEKELGIKDKKEIEAMGVAKFNEFCRSRVFGFIGEWKKTVRKMGKWIDFDNSYKTMDNTYMESVWSLFKTFYDSGYIFEGKKVLMYCPHCQTPLANSEIAMDNSYKDVTEKTATVAFKVKGKEGTFLLVWTTTPWTLIGNVAVAANPKLKYVLADVFGKKFILAKDLLEKNFKHFEIVEELSGKDVIGLEYEPLYDVPTGDKKGFYVIDGANGVTSEEGTGLVHMALYGDFDYEMIKKYKLPVVQHIANDGTLILGPKAWLGKWFKKLDAEVLSDLQDRSLLIEAKDFTHSYPFCYRCKTPLIYNAVDSWFIDIQKIRPKLMERAKEINWFPGGMEARFKYILETAPDWSISRNRFWATAIPVWKCQKCREVKVIGGVKELRENAAQKLLDEVDLHKHVVDGIRLRCKCGGVMNRIPEVLDCWFESGSMPFAAKHFPFENEGWFKANFPADFVSEYVAQIRAWFYYMHVVSVLLFDKVPFKNVVVSGNVLAGDGSKMSKSKGNFPDPDKVFQAYGADALRLYLMASPLMRAEDLNFSEDGVKEMHRKVIMLLANVKNFYGLFSEGGADPLDASSKNILDKWMLSRTNELIKNASKYLDDYNTIPLCAELVSFVDDLSTWFLRRSRDRFKSGDAKERKNALNTLAYALLNVSKVMAPIAPFISEEVYQSLQKSCKNLKESVHLDDWPKANAKLISAEVNEKMALVRGLVSRALDERIKAGVPVRQALSKLEITFKDDQKLEPEYLELIKDEVNVKSAVVSKGSVPEGAQYVVVLDSKITPALLREGISRELIRKVNDYRKELALTINDKISLGIESSDALVKESIKEFANEIKQSVQALELKDKASLPAKEAEVNSAKVKISIKKL